MKSILEVSPRGDTLYEMPDEVYEVAIALMPAYRIIYRAKPTMDRVLSCLPKKLRDTVSKTSPDKKKPLAGFAIWTEQTAPL